jgi:hypothetical protein
MKQVVLIGLILLGSSSAHSAENIYGAIDGTRAYKENIGETVAVCNTVLNKNVEGQATQPVIDSFRTEVHKNDIGKYGILSELRGLGHWCPGYNVCGQTVDGDQVHTFWNRTLNRESYHMETWYNLKSKQLRVQKIRKYLSSEIMVDMIVQCE